MGKGRQGCKCSPGPQSCCVYGQWASSGCKIESRVPCELLSIHRLTTCPPWDRDETTRDSCLDASKEIMTSTKIFTFPLLLCCQLLCPRLVGKFCALEVGGRVNTISCWQAEQCDNVRLSEPVPLPRSTSCLLHSSASPPRVRQASSLPPTNTQMCH